MNFKYGWINHCILWTFLRLPRETEYEEVVGGGAGGSPNRDLCWLGCINILLALPTLPANICDILLPGSKADPKPLAGFCNGWLLWLSIWPMLKLPPWFSMVPMPEPGKIELGLLTIEPWGLYWGTAANIFCWFGDCWRGAACWGWGELKGLGTLSWSCFWTCFVGDVCSCIFPKRLFWVNILEDGAGLKIVWGCFVVSAWMKSSIAGTTTGLLLRKGFFAWALLCFYSGGATFYLFSRITSTFYFYGVFSSFSMGFTSTFSDLWGEDSSMDFGDICCFLLFFWVIWSNDNSPLFSSINYWLSTITSSCPLSDYFLLI